MSEFDGFKYLTNSLNCRIEIERSIFIGDAVFAQTVTDAQKAISQIKKQHYSATHNCYAYICDFANTVKYFDDGEPTGTAGLPILEVMRQKKIINCLVVVTRYFGGKKLGAGGLVRAYSSCAAQLLSAPGIQTYKFCNFFELSLSYDLLPILNAVLQTQTGVYVQTTTYLDNVTITIAVEEKLSNIVQNQIIDKMFGKIIIKKIKSGYLGQ